MTNKNSSACACETNQAGSLISEERPDCGHEMEIKSHIEEPVSQTNTNAQQSEHSCCHGHNPLPSIQDDSTELMKASATRAVYRIMNMDCPVEEELIRKKLNEISGIKKMEFNLLQRVLSVEHHLKSTKVIEDALNSIDMKPQPLGITSEAEASAPQTAIPWLKLILAGIFAAASEATELLYNWKITTGASGSSFTILEYLPLLLAIIAIFFSGLSTYRKGWLAIKNFNLNINALMSVAVTGAVFIGHYPEAAMVMVLFNLSEAIEARSLDRVRNAIKDLIAISPEKATVQQSDGGWLEMETKSVPIGSRVRLRPGERIPLDGIVILGQSSVDQSPITGESMAVEKSVGDILYAGSINESGSLEFEVSAAATDSTLARIIHKVEEAQSSRAPVQRFVDQFAKYYTPIVFSAAILTALFPPLLMDGAWSDWIYRALVLLVIGCPCALVISTPVTIVSGMAAATKHGILVKGGIFLEKGRLIRSLAMDKTGTLTHGKPRQTDFLLIGDMEKNEAVTLAASIAALSDHPVSKAISLAAGPVSLRNVSNFSALPGMGSSGLIDGQKWLLGNHRLVEEVEKCSPELEAHIFALEQQGKSVVALISQAGVQALFAVADTLKRTSIEAVKELQTMGIKTIMLTGDNEHTAEVIAHQVGVDEYEANLLPEDKLAAVENLAKNGLVGMVGDGINDSPALAQADIGFAMGAAGTDTAIETADVALMDDDLRKIPRFIKLSKATYAIVLQNIILALGVKAVFLILTFTGEASMWMAVFADVGTSLLVVFNGLRALKK